VKPAATALIAGILFVWGVLAAAWAPPSSVEPVLLHQLPDGPSSPAPGDGPTIGRASPPATVIAARPVPRPVGRAPLGTYAPGRVPDGSPQRQREAAPHQGTAPDHGAVPDRGLIPDPGAAPGPGAGADSGVAPGSGAAAGPCAVGGREHGHGHGHGGPGTWDGQPGRDASGCPARRAEHGR
jgi:hypothetical protein